MRRWLRPAVLTAAWLLILLAHSSPSLAAVHWSEADCTSSSQLDLPRDWRTDCPSDPSPPLQSAAATSNASTLHATTRSLGPLSAPLDGSLSFDLITDAAPWPPRYRGATGLWAKPLTFLNSASLRSLQLHNPLILYGGLHNYAGVSVVNDVWASSDALRWYLIAGRTRDDAAAEEHADTSYLNLFHGAQFTAPATNAFWRIGGFRINGFSDSTAGWMSNDGGLTWTDYGSASRTPVESHWSQAAANTQNHILLIGGVDDSDTYSNDVWLSTNNLRTWTSQSTAPPFGVRVFSTVNVIQLAGGPEVFLHIGGRSTLDNFNDIWASSDDGRHWVAITTAAPWAQRCYHSTIVTKDGLLLVIAGRGDTTPGFNAAEPLNDVQLSADGGFTWHQCVLDAEWEDRGYQSATLDVDGRLLIMAGLTTGRNGASIYRNDVWRSTISFHDLAAVSKACNVVLPTCGTGLRCWPDGSTVVAADGSFVSCSACPHPSLSSAAYSTGMAVALGLFVALAVVVTGALVYVLHALGKAGVESPLPLPRFMQSLCLPSTAYNAKGNGFADGLLAVQTDATEAAANTTKADGTE